jgi:hypothetical protein
MKSLLKIGLIIISFCLFANLNVFGQDISPELKKKLDLEAEKIKGWVSQAIIVDAVKAQNGQMLSLDEIKKRDVAWIKVKKAKGNPNGLMKQTQNHATGKWLKKKNKENRGKYPEAFLCDNQGANVAVSKLTSDYWQGDEGKWKNAFNGGNGKVFYGDPEFDKSAKSMLVQISVPVNDSGKTIGVLVVGVKFSALKKK